MIKPFIVLVFINTLWVSALKQCCQGENEIKSPVKKCSDGKPLDISPCQRYILSKNEMDVRTDVNDNLIIEYENPLSADK